MSKIKIKTSLKATDSNEKIIIKEFIGIKNDNRIIYNDDKVSVTILLINNTIKMKRLTDEYTIELLFDNKKTTNGIYTINDLRKTLDLKIKTYILNIDDNNIIIEYEIINFDKTRFRYDLNYEVIL